MTSQPPPYHGGNEFDSLPPYAGGYTTPPKNGLSIAAMVLGIVAIPGALVTAGTLGIICGILAIVFGLIGMRQANQGRSNRKGFAITGLVTGIVGVIVGVGILAFVIWAYHRAQACENRIGHYPSRSELEECVQEGI